MGPLIVEKLIQGEAQGICEGVDFGLVLSFSILTTWPSRFGTNGESLIPGRDNTIPRQLLTSLIHRAPSSPSIFCRQWFRRRRHVYTCYGGNCRRYTTSEGRSGSQARQQKNKRTNRPYCKVTGTSWPQEKAQTVSKPNTPSNAAPQCQKKNPPTEKNLI